MSGDTSSGDESDSKSNEKAFTVSHITNGKLGICACNIYNALNVLFLFYNKIIIFFIFIYLFSLHVYILCVMICCKSFFLIFIKKNINSNIVVNMAELEPQFKTNRI